MTKKIRIYILVLVIGCILSSCNYIEDSSTWEESNSQEQFEYGDELTFYLNDEKVSENPSPIIVVTQLLEAQTINDFDTWLSLLTDDNRKGFSNEVHHDFGIISFEIIDIHYETDIKYKQSILGYEKAINMSLTADNIAIVTVKYDAAYDHTKVPLEDGEVEWQYTLIRDNNKSPWYIQSWGYGYGGI